MFGCNRTLRTETDFEPAVGRRFKELQLFQAFSAAGHAFRVIDEDTVSVLTPYQEGKELAALLCTDQPIRERVRTLRAGAAVFCRRPAKRAPAPGAGRNALPSGGNGHFCLKGRALRRKSARTKGAGPGDGLPQLLRAARREGGRRLTKSEKGTTSKKRRRRLAQSD